MPKYRKLISFAMLGLLAGSPTFAQDEAAAYPAVCRTDDAHAGHGADAPPATDMASMNEHQRASMQGMDQMNRNMMQGMMKEDADVAFACGMIAHHQGAIDMAKVELEHGDDQEMKQLAEKIIADQQREIFQMTEWLEQNAQ